MDIEQRIQELEKKLKAAQTMAGGAIGIAGMAFMIALLQLAN